MFLGFYFGRRSSEVMGSSFGVMAEIVALRAARIAVLSELSGCYSLRRIRGDANVVGDSRNVMLKL